MMLRAVILISLMGMTLAGCKSKKDRQADTPKTFRITLSDVEEKNISQPIYTSGMLSSKELIKLSFKIAGIVNDIFVEEGNSVKRGQPLAQLELTEINAKLQQAETAYEKAEQDLQRIQNLYKDSVVTEEQLQNAGSQLKVAGSDLEIAKFNVEHATIKAPVRGKITKKLAEENELVSPGMPIFLLASMEQNLVVRVGLTEKDILKLQIGDSALVRFDAYPDLDFHATVDEIAAALDAQSGTYEVELSVSDSGKKLLTGFTASVTIFPSQRESYKLIPIESLMKADGFEGYVFTVSEDGAQAVRVPVKVAFLMKDKVAIKSGLEGVTRVVKTGADYLYSGAKVEIIED